MTLYLLVFGLSLAFGLAATPLARWLGHRCGILDHPDGYRKVHKKPIPRSGGVAVYLAFFGSLAAAVWLSPAQELHSCLGADDFRWLLLGATAIFLIGLWDDARGLNARKKLVLLTLVAGGLYAAGFRIGAITNPFGGSIYLGHWALPVTLFWFLGCMNAINFIDGLDGLATGVAAFVAATIVASGLLFGNFDAVILAVALLGAAGGFLVFNFHPASIYLGDSGAYLLGYLIACVGLLSTRKAHTAVALLVPVIAMGVPIFDTALAIVRRWARAVPISASDRHHLHHRLLKWGFGHRQAVLFMYMGCFALAALALIMAAAHGLQSTGVLLILALFGALTIRLLGWHEVKLAHKRVTDHLERRKRHASGRKVGYEATERMRQAQNVEAVWEAFTAAAAKLELDQARLALAPGRITPPIWQDVYTLDWTRDGNGSTDEQLEATWSANYPLVVGGFALGTLDITKATNGKPLEGHVPEMLHLLTARLAENVARLSPSSLQRSGEFQRHLPGGPGLALGAQQLTLWP